MSKISFNKKLAVVAFILSFFAMIFSFIFPKGLKNKEKPKYISVYTLAQKIKNKENIQVIDLRKNADFKKFHIPTAKNILIKNWLKPSEESSDLLVFYSGDDFLTRKLWIQLPESIKKISTVLYGGIHDWYEMLLYPKLPINASKKDSIILKNIKTLTKYFGGKIEFVNDYKTLNYYKKDISNANWSSKNRKNSLVHKGC